MSTVVTFKKKETKPETANKKRSEKVSVTVRLGTPISVKYEGNKSTPVFDIRLMKDFYD